MFVHDDSAGSAERRYRELAAASRLGAGQLAVNVGSGGRPRQRSAVLHWFDVDADGRYLALGDDGHATVRPADQDTLLRHLDALLP